MQLSLIKSGMNQNRSKSAKCLPGLYLISTFQVWTWINNTGLTLTYPEKEDQREELSIINVILTFNLKSGCKSWRPDSQDGFGI